MVYSTGLHSVTFNAGTHAGTATGLAFVPPSSLLSPRAAINPTRPNVSALTQQCSTPLRATPRLASLSHRSLSQTSSPLRSHIQLKCKHDDGVEGGENNRKIEGNIDGNQDSQTDSIDSEKNLLQKLNIDVPPEVLDLYNQFKAFENPIPGIQIGIPLNLFAQIFTHHHYGENIMGPGDIFLQCCIGYFTYGIDRFLDAQEAENSPNEEISVSKKARYDAIKEHRNSVLAAIAGSGIYTLQELNKSPETRPFIPLLASTLFYKQIKTHFGPVKPFYLSAMWALSSTVLPAVMHDHDWSILASPQDYLAPFLLLFGTTNFVDIRDFEEDKANGVSTLPTAMGKEKTVLMSTAALALFAFIMNSK